MRLLQRTTLMNNCFISAGNHLKWSFKLNDDKYEEENIQLKFPHFTIFRNFPRRKNFFYSLPNKNYN